MLSAFGNILGAKLQQKFLGWFSSRSQTLFFQRTNAHTLSLTHTRTATYKHTCAIPLYLSLSLSLFHSLSLPALYSPSTVWRTNWDKSEDSGAVEVAAAAAATHQAFFGKARYLILKKKVNGKIHWKTQLQNVLARVCVCECVCICVRVLKCMKHRHRNMCLPVCVSVRKLLRVWIRVPACMCVCVDKHAWVCVCA